MFLNWVWSSRGAWPFLSSKRRQTQAQAQPLRLEQWYVECLLFFQPKLVFRSYMMIDDDGSCIHIYIFHFRSTSCQSLVSRVSCGCRIFLYQYYQRFDRIRGHRYRYICNLNIQSDRSVRFPCNKLAS